MKNTEISQNPTLNKFLASAGVASRRKSVEFIESGKVKVNGKVILEPGYRVTSTDIVFCNNVQVRTIEDFVYYLINKPVKYVTSTSDPQGRDVVVSLVKDNSNILPVGRLDYMTSGVLLLTNDNELIHKLTHPSFNVKKKYQVLLDKRFVDEEGLTKGIQLEDGFIKPDKVDCVGERVVNIEIHSGKNRVVRRIFETLGYKVLTLERINFAGLEKGSLLPGEYRALSKKEVDSLKTE